MEMRLGPRLYRYFSSKHLSDVRTLVARADDATVYLKSFSKAQGFELDFEAMNRRRCAALPSNHPLYLIEPYIQIDEMPFDIISNKKSDVDA